MHSKETMNYLADKYLCRICDAVIDEEKGDDKTTFDGGYVHCGRLEELIDGTNKIYW